MGYQPTDRLTPPPPPKPYKRTEDKFADYYFGYGGMSDCKCATMTVCTMKELADVAKTLFDGSLVYCSDNNKTYMAKNGYLVVYEVNNTDGTVSNYEPHEIKKTTCDACGAHLPINNVNNNGVCKCEYCDTFHYVW